MNRQNSLSLLFILEQNSLLVNKLLIIIYFLTFLIKMSTCKYFLYSLYIYIYIYIYVYIYI